MSADAAGGFAADRQAQLDVADARGALAADGFVAHEVLDRLAELHKQYPQAEPVIALLDQILFQREDWEALIALHRGKSSRTDDPRHQAYLAFLMNKVSRYEDAERLLAPIYETRPGHPQVAVPLAMAVLQQGRPEEAAAILDAHFDRFVEAEPVTARLVRGAAYFEAGDYETARDLFEHAWRLSPDSVVIAFELMRVYEKLGDEERSERYAQRTQALRDQERAQVRWRGHAYRLGRAWMEQRYEECLARLASLSEMSPDPVAAVVLKQIEAVVLAAAGEHDRASAARQDAQAGRAQLGPAAPLTPMTRALLMESGMSSEIAP